MPFHASIATAKAGVEGLVKSLGAELASTVRVNAIAPTITETTLAANILRNDRMRKHGRASYEKLFETRRSSRHGCFITSEKAKSISGQIFEMDYGIVSFKI
jgi:NAD(P)-dependent dehydrogenase (short-subunit alcohol dehydrogenase family)